MYTSELIIYREYMYYYLETVPYLSKIYTTLDFATEINTTLNSY